MGQKLKMILAVTIIGFIGFALGAIANLTYIHIFPLITKALPHFFTLEWVIWGLAGAFLAIACCLIYAYLP